MKNRKGERGLPCLIPLEGERVWEGTPLTRIEKNVEDMRFVVQEIHSLLKPKLVKRVSMYC
jgi:hypothetical protein